jgi:DNA topoisomerase VI subunit A
LVTGKGYSDFGTKQFLLNLLGQDPKIIFFYLGDFDVHGLDIYLDYLFGSEMSVYEV